MAKVRPSFSLDQQMRTFLALVFLALFSLVLGKQACNDPSKPLIISSTVAQMKIASDNATFCAKNPETGIADCSSWIAYQLRTIEERSNPSPDMLGVCYDWPIISPGVAVNTLKMVFVSDMDCQAEVIDEVLAPGVGARIISLNYTLASMPSLSIQLNYTVANASLDINLGSSSYSEGRNMIVSYRYVVILLISHTSNSLRT